MDVALGRKSAVFASESLLARWSDFPPRRPTSKCAAFALESHRIITFYRLVTEFLSSLFGGRFVFISNILSLFSFLFSLLDVLCLSLSLSGVSGATFESRKRLRSFFMDPFGSFFFLLLSPNRSGPSR